MPDESSIIASAETAGPLECRLMLLIDADREIEAWGELGNAIDKLMYDLYDVQSAVTHLYELHERQELEEADV